MSLNSWPTPRRDCITQRMKITKEIVSKYLVVCSRVVSKQIVSWSSQGVLKNTWLYEALGLRPAGGSADRLGIECIFEVDVSLSSLDHSPGLSRAVLGFLYAHNGLSEIRLRLILVFFWFLLGLISGIFPQLLYEAADRLLEWAAQFAVEQRLSRVNVCARPRTVMASVECM